MNKTGKMHPRALDTEPMQKALALLRNKPEVSAFDLQAETRVMSVSELVSSLRRHGFKIDNRLECVNGKRHSFYRLLISGELFA